MLSTDYLADCERLRTYGQNAASYFTFLALLTRTAPPRYVGNKAPNVWDSPSNPADWPELSVPSPLGGLPVLSFLSERSLPNRTLRTALGWLSHEE